MNPVPASTPAPTGYIPIKTDFNSKGFNFKQVCREGDLAIYEQSKIGGTHTTNSFEVIRINRHNGYKIADQAFPPAEMYPSNSQWGSHGWTLPTLVKAYEKMDWIKNHFLPAEKAELGEVTKRKQGRPRSPERLARDAAVAQASAESEATLVKDQLPDPPTEIFIPEESPKTSGKKPKKEKDANQLKLNLPENSKPA